MDTLNQILTAITDFLGKLNGLPGIVLTLFACIAIGYVWKAFKRLPNDAIPAVVMFTGVVLNMLLADPKADTLPLRLWVAKNAVVGLIIGFLAWLTHRKLLRKLEDKIPFLKGWLADTEEFKNPNPPKPDETKP